MLCPMSFATLFPPGVIAVSTETDSPQGTLYPAEAAHVRHAVPKRRREFTLGRLYARVALRRLGIVDYPLLAGTQREPRWPPGVAGSITHCDRFCAVAVARAPIRGIGIDAETRGPLPDGVAALVYTPNEGRWLESAQDSRAGDWAKLIFSAKESVYKCQFPLTGVALDFPDVEIVPATAPGEFVATISDAKPVPAELRILHGRFAFGADHVYTTVIVTAAAKTAPTPALPPERRPEGP